MLDTGSDRARSLAIKLVVLTECTVLYCTVHKAACTDRVVPRLKDIHGLYLAAGGKDERGVARLV